MKKIKVLVVPSDRTGVSYYRSTNPHIALENNYPNEFHVDVDYEPQLNNDEWLKQYDIIHYHRTLGSYDQMQALLEKLKSFGIVTIMDLDDYWSPGTHHPAYYLIKSANLDKMILNNIKIAENVTTTTSLFAEEISKYNENVYVLANAIDPTEKQFTPNLEPSNGRLRIGWLGGSSHLKDLEILRGVVGKLKTDNLIDKVQFVLCGFDIRGSHTEIDQNTGEQRTRAIKPMESVWYQYEKIFTDDYKTISPEYKDFLMKFIPNSEFEGVENQAYRRVWTKPISTYASNYNLFDVSLAPLEENIFNKVKSQLKVIEAGFHNKAIIAQNFGPYKIDLKNAIKFGGGFEEDGNGILIDTGKNHKDWYASIKKLIQNPDVVKQLQENLHNTIKDTYSIDKVTEQRRELYLNLLTKKQEKIIKEETINA
jgi:glycosyltransferase involved in cell wall biosynthesis